MDLRVLGDIEASVDGRVVDLGGPRQRLLLAVLLTEPDAVVGTSRLVEALWDGEERPERPERAVQTYVSRLRKTLGADRIITRRPGYGLVVRDGELDAERYAAAVAEAGRRRAAGDLSGALDAVLPANDLWRGEPWAELADRFWAVGPAGRLREVRAGAAELEVGLLVDLDDPAAALSRLEPLLAEHPVHDGLRRLQLLVLHRTGRSVEATRAFQRYRDRVVAETGLEPSAELAALEAAILRDDPALATATPTVRGFELIERIGSGRTSVVWRARQASLDREVALKVLRSELADDVEVIRGFERRARVLSGLAHPHLVPLVDAWRDHRGAYVVMPLLSPAAAQRPVGGWGPGAVTRLVGDGADALAALHGTGIVLGELGADDVLLTDDGRAVLAGLGVIGPSTQSPADDVAALARVGLDLLGEPAEATPLASILTAAASGEVSDAAVLRDALGRGPRPQGGPIRNPYKGLAAFDVGDAEDFFGRKDIVAGLVERTTTERLVAVVGPSGSGKSSVVRAGLLPTLARRAELGGLPWFGVTMVPGADPWEGLEAGLLRLAVNPPASLRDQLLADDRGLLRAVTRCLPDGRSDLLLVIDQFEELWTLTDAPTRDAFVAALVAAVSDPASRLRAVVTVRADLWDRPLSDPRLGERLARSAVSLPALSAEQLEEVVLGPARRVGLGIEATVVAELVRTGLTEPAALPLVQFTLTELADRVDGDVVTAADLAALGGVEGAVARRAEDVFAGLDEPHRAATRTLFGRLVSVTGGTPTRQRSRTAELDDDARDVVEAFGSARLLTYDRDAETREQTVEVAHESLLTAWPRLRDWVADDADELRTAGRVSTRARTWEASGHDDGELLRGAPLAAATALVGGRPERFTPSERAFVAAGEAQVTAERDQERRQYRRVRAALAAVAVLLAVALGAGFVALGQRDDARAASFDNETQRLALAAPELVETDPSLALLLAAEAHRRDPGPLGLGGLQRVMTRTDRFLGLLTPGVAVEGLAWLDDETLAVVGPDTIRLVDTTTRVTIASESLTPMRIWPAAAAVVAASPAARLVAAAEPAGGVVVLDEGLAEVNRWSVGADVRSLAFSPDGGRLFIGDGAGAVHEADPAGGGVIRSWSAHPPGPLEIPGDTLDYLVPIYQALGNLGVVAIAVTDDAVVTSGHFDVARWDRSDGDEVWRTSGPLVVDTGVPGFQNLPLILSIDPSAPNRVLMAGGRRFGTLDMSSGRAHPHRDPVADKVGLGASRPDQAAGGGLVALAAQDGLVRVYDPVTGERPQAAVEVGLGGLRTVAISPGGRTLASGTAEGALLHALDGSGLVAEGLPVDRTDHDYVSIARGGHLATVSSFTPGRSVLWERDTGGWTQRPFPPGSDHGWLELLDAGDIPEGMMMDWVNVDWGSVRYRRLDDLEPAGELILGASGGPASARHGLLLATPVSPRLAGGPVVRYHRIPSGELVREVPVPPELAGVRLMHAFVGDLVLGHDGAGGVVAFDHGAGEFVDAPFTTDVPVSRIRTGPRDRHLYVARVDGLVEERDIGTFEVTRVFDTAQAATSEDVFSIFVDPWRQRMLSTTGKGPQLTDLSTGQLVGGPFPADPDLVVGGGADATADEPLQLITAVGPHAKVWNLDTDTWFDIACRAAGRNLTRGEWDRLGPRDTAYRATCPQWSAA